MLLLAGLNAVLAGSASAPHLSWTLWAVAALSAGLPIGPIVTLLFRQVQVVARPGREVEFLSYATSALLLGNAAGAASAGAVSGVWVAGAWVLAAALALVGGVAFK